MLQFWLTLRQSRAYLRAMAELRRSGTVSTAKSGKRYRGGVTYLSLATDGNRVTGAVSLKGFTTFARPAPVPALAGMRLGAVAGDRAIPGLTDSERAAARDAVRLLRTAHRTAEPTAGTSSPGAKGVRIPTGAVPPA
jgi:DNA-binding transcriptional regulator of glucitol operon